MTVTGKCFVLSAASLVLFLIPHGAIAQDADQDNGWPQVIATNDNEVTVYQPQVESWKDNMLSARAAVSVKTASSTQAEFGVVSFTARTEVDRSAGIVTFNDLKITGYSFPGSDNPGALKSAIEFGMPGWPNTIALERLVADLAIVKAEMKTQRLVPVTNAPPKIIYSTEPAVLVLVDGTPVPRPVENTNLSRIINTQALIFIDKSGGYFLRIAKHWEHAASIEGPWSPATDIPDGLDQAMDLAVKSRLGDPLDGPGKDDTGDEKPPSRIRIYVSTAPAELIQTDGPINLQPIDGTKLLYAKNSGDHIFVNMADKYYFILVAGRWLRSPSLEKGSWEYVPGESLPKDFGNIPADHQEGEVLASVPGTTQASEAVISDSIPQTNAIQRGNNAPAAVYDGEPRFDPIEGTTLFYAVNSPLPIIRVNDSNYYMVQNGVWYASSSPTGTWRIADSVPAVIYTIPPSNRLHYVTYVKIYDANNDYIYTGYTPGYYGSYIGTSGTVVYGTGYCYTPWVGTVWYGPPVTYGLGYRYGWYGWGWGWGHYYGPSHYYPWRPYYRPWWGPCYGGRCGYYGHANYNNYRNPYLYRGSYNQVHVNERYADPQGYVYRRGASGGWERNMGGDQWKSSGSQKYLNDSERARSEGVRRYNNAGGSKQWKPSHANPPAGHQGKGGGGRGHR